MSTLTINPNHAEDLFKNSAVTAEAAVPQNDSEQALSDREEQAQKINEFVQTLELFFLNFYSDQFLNHTFVPTSLDDEYIILNELINVVFRNPSLEENIVIEFSIDDDEVSETSSTEEPSKNAAAEEASLEKNEDEIAAEKIEEAVEVEEIAADAASVEKEEDLTPSAPVVTDL